MNLAEFSINKKVITYTLTAVALYVGYLSFNSLPRLEDPEFAIKQALIITSYPGASAAEVEKEVTEVIEKAAQEMGQLKFVESWSERGLSKVKVFLTQASSHSTSVGQTRAHMPPMMFSLKIVRAEPRTLSLRIF